MSCCYQEKQIDILAINHFFVQKITYTEGSFCIQIVKKMFLKNIYTGSGQNIATQIYFNVCFCFFIDRTDDYGLD